MLCAFFALPALALATPTFHDADYGTNDSSGTSLATPAIDVTSGDMIVCGLKWEGTATVTAGVTYSQSGGGSVTNTGNTTVGNHTVGGGDLHGQVFYARATSTGTVTATFTLSGGAPYRIIACMTFTPAAGQSLSFDGSVGPTNFASSGTGSTLQTASRTISAAGFSATFAAKYGSTGSSAPTNWVVPTALDVGSALSADYRLQATSANYVGEITLLTSTPETVLTRVDFIESAAGGGGTVVNPMSGRGGAAAQPAIQ